jgi:hypothetical protein
LVLQIDLFIENVFCTSRNDLSVKLFEWSFNESIAAAERYKRLHTRRWKLHSTMTLNKEYLTTLMLESTAQKHGSNQEHESTGERTKTVGKDTDQE